MKFSIKILLIILCLVILTGCGSKPPGLSDRVSTDSTSQADMQNEKSYTGVIESVSVDVYKDGTHQIKTDEGEAIVIQSSTVNLTNYIDKKVTITGSMQKLIDDKNEVFTVTSIKSDSDQDEKVTEYKNSQLGFQLKYTDTWEATEGTDVVTFSSSGADWVKIDILSDANSDLDKFVKSKESEDGTAVTISSQRSLRYTDADAIRVYIPNNAKKKVYKITFNDKGEDKDTHKKSFYLLLESFKLLGSESAKGKKCGGEDAVICEENYRCELESGEENAEGVCIAVKSGNSIKDCPYAPTPSNCSNYKTKSVNKDNCPTSYECLDKPKKTEPEPEVVEDKQDTEDTKPKAEEIKEPAKTSETDVDKYFVKNQSSVLPKNAKLLQLEVVSEQKLVYAIYTLDEKKYRNLYEFSKSGNDYSFTKKASYTAGEYRDWELADGSHVVIKYNKKVVKVAEDSTSSIVVPKNLRLYENKYKNFSLQYSKNWYYRSFGSLNSTIVTVGFGGKILNSLDDASVTVKILKGSASNKKEMKGSTYVAIASRDDNSHFVVSGSIDMKDEVDKMVASIINN